MSQVDKLSVCDASNEWPVTEAGAVAFLSGPMVEGIGPVYARRIVETLGVGAAERMIADPEVAAGVKGLGAERIAKAVESLKALRRPIGLLQFLYSCGVGDLLINRIFGKYRSRTAEVIKADPYAMVEDVWQLSFFTADKIGNALGIAPDDPRRLRGALVGAVKHFAEGGDLFATPEQAAEFASSITGVPSETVIREIGSTVRSGRLVESRGGLYLPVFYRAEKQGARRLRRLAESSVPQLRLADIPLYSLQGHRYSEDQRLAILAALNSPVMVLTGGPGSGKTTVLRGVIDLLEKAGLKVTLAAPTGRAAKRITTLTGVDAFTIHRLLGYRQGEGYDHKPINTDALIIDEGSMMEQVLLDHLLEAVRPGTRIIIVGDPDQLPAIGAGDVLHDLIESGSIPVAHLHENFRQGVGSLIAGGAAAIRSGRMPATNPKGDLVLVEESSATRIHDRILSLIETELPQERGVRPEDILVVTPQQIGPLGARRLNDDLRERLNPEGPELRRGATVMRLGDPVMQTANSRERGVYNGETGRIIDVDPERQILRVRFADGRESEYARSELSELTPAYATTVHKLQGSEARNIIFPITMAHKPMLYRNLLYTGVSRATDLCVLVGEKDALRYAIDNTPALRRNSNFAGRLASGQIQP